MTFVLEPLYKVYATILGEHDTSVKDMMEELVRVCCVSDIHSSL